MIAGGHHLQMPATWSLSRTKLPQKRKIFGGEGVISGAAPRARTARVFVVRTTRPKTSLTRLILRLEGYLTAGTSDFGEAKRWLAANGVFPLLKSLLPVVVAFLLPTTETLDHRRVGNGTHRHGLFQEPMEELPAMA